MPLILFDIDMTLIHTNGAGRLAMDRALGEWFNVEAPTAGISFDGRTDRAIFEETLSPLADGIADAFDRLAIGYLERLPAALEERGGHLLPGVADLLDALEGERSVFGLATGNMRRGAMLKLAHFGIDSRFLGGGFGDDEVVRANVVRAGIAELRERSGSTDGGTPIVLGDTPLDIEAAHAAGARALGVATGRFGAEALAAAGADWALEDLADTARVLEILLGRAD